MIFFVKQKTAYEMRISDWSSDVCSSDLVAAPHRDPGVRRQPRQRHPPQRARMLGAAPLPEGAGGIAIAVPDPGTARGAGRGRGASSDERRVGKEWVSTFSSRWSPYYETNKTVQTMPARY